MRVLIAAGGTAGHVNPALAIADYISKNEKDAKILFVGTPNGMEKQLVQNAGYDFLGIKVHGFQRSLSLKNIGRNFSAVFRILTSSADAHRILKSFKPDIVIGTGGYVSGPVVRKAVQMKIKTAIHEQNAFPGVTNKLLAKKVDLVFLASEDAKKYLANEASTFVVGNPIREQILYCTKKKAREKLGMDDHFCILSFGGSLGAAIINEIGADLMAWHGKDGNINHIHVTGKYAEKGFQLLLEKRNITIKQNTRMKVYPYLFDMETYLAAADLVICRAGALTISELQATGKASILIPSPYVAENHQYYNAMALQDRGAAVVVKENEYRRKDFIQIVQSFYENPEKLKQYSKNASQNAILDSCKRIYDEIIKLM